MMSWKAGLAALLALAACGESKPEPAPAPEPVVEAPPKPAIWKIADADTTVYFFGTVHVLPPTLTWHSPAVDAALKEAKALYFETNTEADPIVFREIVSRLGNYEPGDKLSDRLKLADLEKLRAALDKLDIPLVTIEAMRPWYAGVVIGDAVVRKAGYDASSGVENVMRPEARKAGKEIRFLETLEEQMASFATLPEDVQLQFLLGGLAEVDTASEELGKLVDAWKRGDLETLNRLLIEEDFATIPALYDALLKHRNANWAPEIDTLMKAESGAFMVAVGTAHLIGKDSVLEMLKTAGYTVERIQ